MTGSWKWGVQGEITFPFLSPSREGVFRPWGTAGEYGHGVGIQPHFYGWLFLKSSLGTRFPILLGVTAEFGQIELQVLSAHAAGSWVCVG